jgi:hypothetical protein
VRHFDPALVRLGSKAPFLACLLGRKRTILLIKTILDPQHGRARGISLAEQTEML